MATSIILDTTSALMKKRQKAITYINEGATDNQIIAFANAINALSTDTLDKISRVDKREIENSEYQIIGPRIILAPVKTNGTAFYPYAIVDSNGTTINQNLNYDFVNPDIDKIEFAWTTQSTLYIKVNTALTEPLTGYADLSAVVNGIQISARITIQFIPTIVTN